MRVPFRPAVFAAFMLGDPPIFAGFGPWCRTLLGDEIAGRETAGWAGLADCPGGISCAAPFLEPWARAEIEG